MADTPEAMTLMQFAARRGLTTTHDVDSHIHAGLRSAPTSKSYRKWFEAETRRLQDARDETTRLFRQAIEAGEIREHTRHERLMRAAAGHPDKPSTAAAQRLLAKRAARATPHREGE